MKLSVPIHFRGSPVSPEVGPNLKHRNLEFITGKKSSESCLFDQFSDLPSARLVFEYGSGHILLTLHAIVILCVYFFENGPEGRVGQIHPQSSQNREVSSLEQQPAWRNDVIRCGWRLVI